MTDVDEYGIPIKTASAPADEFGIPIKKKVDTSVSAPTAPSLSIGSPNFLSTPQSIENSPVSDPALREQMKQQREQRAADLSNHLKENIAALNPEAKAAIEDAIPKIANNDNITAETPEEKAHYDFMQTIPGKIIGNLKYVQSKATKGTIDVVKGAAHLASLPLPKAMTPDFDTPLNKLTDAANFGLSESDQDRLTKSNPLLNPVGMMAEFAPAIAGGEASGAPKTLMYMQGVGQGKDLADKIPGLNPVAKEALIQGSGAVNLLLTDVFKGAKISPSLQGKIVSSIAADAIKESAGKDISTTSFKDLLTNKAATAAQWLEQSPVEAMAHYNETAKTFLKLNAANFALHKGVDALNDKPVFNESLGDLADAAKNSLTKEAPIFAALPAIGALSKLTPLSSYKNEAAESIMRNPSDQNVLDLKQQIAEHGTKQGWTPEETNATLGHVDEIAKAAKTLPNTIPDEKKADAIDLVMNRNDLQDRLAKVQENKKQLDPSLQELPNAQETYLTDKIEQANDKLRNIVTGGKTTYSKGIGDEEGKFFKTTNGTKEEIEPSRYELENTERTAKSNINNLIPTKNESENEQTKIGATEDEEGSTESSVAEQPVNSTSIEESTKKGDETNGERNVVEGGDEPPFKEKAIDAVTHGIVYSPDEKFDGYAPRFDFGMSKAEKDKAVNDIKNGNYETAPAKKMLSKLQEWDKNDNYPIIEGNGGHTERRTGATSAEIQKHIDDAKAINLGELTKSQIEEFNKSAKDLGITAEDVKAYEDHRNASNGATDNRRAVESVEEPLQQPGNDTPTSSTQSSSGEAAQGNGDQVKKTILTKRAYEGDIQPEVKKHLEEKGLTRNTFSQEERSKQATDFVNKFGDDAALHAVRSGDVEGGMAASILAQLQIKNSREMSELPTGSEEREDLAKKQADIIDLSEKKGYSGGEFNGQLAYEYQNKELNYASVKRDVERLTNKPLTAEQNKKAEELTAENEKLKKQAQESEAKLIEETDKAFAAGKEEAKNETNAQKAKRLADKIRAGKIHKSSLFSSASPASLAWDTAIEITAKSVEAGGKLADAIQDGLDHIKSTEWYKSLSTPKQQQAEKEFKDSQFNTSGSTDLHDLQERFLDKTDNKFTPSEARDIWKYIKDNYLENGTSYKDAISKTADDLGLSWRQISEAITTPKNKRMSDEMWKRQSDFARHRTAIKNWIDDQNKSTAGKALQKVSGLFRGVAVFGHGGIFMGTHAGMTLFNPSTWNRTVPAFFRGWKYAYGNEAAYIRSMEELKNSPNYVMAQRAGLKNNPERINTEEYQKSQKFLGKLGMAGEKGFNAVKVLRQDLFDYHYDKLTPAERDDPATAASIAHLVNLATGATNIKIPSWVNEATFAGGMEAARWEKLTASPVKATQVALNAIINPSKASTADRVFAKVWARRVGEQLATYSSLLLANAAIQNTLNPKNPVNYTNPNKPDFLKFKFGDLTIDPTSGMRGVGMFMYNLGQIPFESKKELRGEKRIAVAGKNIANYGRGKLAPLYGTAADFFSGADYNNNVMPYSHDKPNKGKHKLEWFPEYISSKAPLPFAEAANVAYKSAEEHGANKMVLNDVLRGIMSGAISGTTGFRVGEYDASAPENNKKHK